jgi:hypothetical protein
MINPAPFLFVDFWSLGAHGGPREPWYKGIPSGTYMSQRAVKSG